MRYIVIEAANPCMKTDGGYKMYNKQMNNLTPKEIEVVRLLTLGLKDSEIAEKLVITTSTAKTHLYRIFEKLGVRTRTEAAIKAIAQGQVECPACKASQRLQRL